MRENTCKREDKNNTPPDLQYLGHELKIYRSYFKNNTAEQAAILRCLSIKRSYQKLFHIHSPRHLIFSLNLFNKSILKIC